MQFLCPHGGTLVELYALQVMLEGSQVVLLAPSGHVLQHVLERFASKVAGMSKSMVLTGKIWFCLPQFTVFLFTSEGKAECQIDRLIGEAAAVRY